jgi:hypothetical protein
MQGALIDSIELREFLGSGARGFCIGHLIHITQGGQALVDYPGNLEGPVAARSVLGTPPRCSEASCEGLPVLLWFENGDPTLPVIVGIIRDTLYPPVPHEEVPLSMERLQALAPDNKRMIFDANEEIVLRCGKSSITLKKDGKIIVKGAQIISRSSGVHKIKGATILIN